MTSSSSGVQRWRSGSAIREGLAVERSDVNGGFNEGNALKLRFVTKPELRLKLGARVRATKAGGELSTFRWFYVYDIEEHDGDTWGLMGETARLFPVRGSREHGRDRSPRGCCWVGCRPFKAPDLGDEPCS